MVQVIRVASWHVYVVRRGGLNDDNGVFSCAARYPGTGIQ